MEISTQSSQLIEYIDWLILRLRNYVLNDSYEFNEVLIISVR